MSYVKNLEQCDHYSNNIYGRNEMQPFLGVKDFCVAEFYILLTSQWTSFLNTTSNSQYIRQSHFLIIHPTQFTNSAKHLQAHQFGIQRSVVYTCTRSIFQLCYTVPYKYTQNKETFYVLNTRINSFILNIKRRKYDFCHHTTYIC